LYTVIIIVFVLIIISANLSEFIPLIGWLFIICFLQVGLVAPDEFSVPDEHFRPSFVSGLMKDIDTRLREQVSIVLSARAKKFRIIEELNLCKSYHYEMDLTMN
jgi:hypothetical protein